MIARICDCCGNDIEMMRRIDPNEPLKIKYKASWLTGCKSTDNENIDVCSVCAGKIRSFANRYKNGETCTKYHIGQRIRIRNGVLGRSGMFYKIVDISERPWLEDDDGKHYFIDVMDDYCKRYIITDKDIEER